MAAHPDDIEFMMSGTLALLGREGYELHYMNVASGSCGSATLARDEIVRIRTEESREAAALLGATWHPPLVDDIEIFYEPRLLARMGAVMREVAPSVLLLQSPQDYMEDHTISSRLAVTAAFCRGMRNYPTDPPTEAVEDPVALYHALPYGLRDQLRKPLRAEFYVDIADVLDVKTAMLGKHRSQKEWLDVSQGLDSYLTTMRRMCTEVAALSGKWAVAEGWRRHLHLGFADEDFDPLAEALRDRIAWDPAYARERRGLSPEEAEHG